MIMRIVLTTLFTFLSGFYVFSFHPWYGFGAKGTYYALLKGIYEGTISDVISWGAVIVLTGLMLAVGIFAGIGLKSLR